MLNNKIKDIVQKFLEVNKFNIFWKNVYTFSSLFYDFYCIPIC